MTTSIKAKMTFLKSTKRKHVYTPVENGSSEDIDNPISCNMYFVKDYFAKGKPPTSIEVTVDFKD